jgi:hypothetical protein
MHSISLWDVVLLFFIRLKRGSSGNVWLQFDGALFPFFFICAMETGEEYKNRAKYRDVENRESNKMGLQVNRVELAVYVYLVGAPNIRGP